MRELPSRSGKRLTQGRRGYDNGISGLKTKIDVPLGGSKKGSCKGAELAKHRIKHRSPNADGPPTSIR